MKKQIAENMVSPLTGGRVYLVEGLEKQTFRKEKYSVYASYYICEDTGEHFTTEEQDEQMFNELYNQYRICHGIPFPEEIKKIREHYQLSYSQITKIVGFGQNQWKQYEDGNMPSVSNGKIIIAIRKREGMLSMLEASKNQFEESTYNKIKQNILCASEIEHDDILKFYYYGNTKRGATNGYSEMNPDKLQCMIQYIVSKEIKGVSKTKLNKEMFYADFYHYKKHGRSISGLAYRAIQYGPVPEHYETIYDHVQGLKKKNILCNGDFDYDLIYCENPDISSLTEEELSTINKVMSLLTDMSRSEIIELSHEENGWINYKDQHNLIPYEEAYTLKAFS